MKKFVFISVAVLLTVLTAGAQQRRFCTRTPEEALTRGLGVQASVSTHEGEWHVPVVFAAFKDVAFQSAETLTQWETMLNQTGYHAHGAAGSLREYFEKQSNGTFTLHFDCLGPVTLPDSMTYYGANTTDSGEDKRPEEMVWKACKALDTDWQRYDWNGDGVVDVVMVVYAGYGENRGGTADAIWPHKTTLYGRQVDGLSLADYACVSELDMQGEVDGYATFCHEFSHTLGLPDLYPEDATIYSYFDEWDLMDGGNYSNGGRAVPNYSAFERYLCGWIDLKELTEPTSVTDLKAMDVQGEAYVIRHSSDAEHYYVLENRQQRGFDAFVPGNGLLVTRVDHFDQTYQPNGMWKEPQVTLVAADNRSYKEAVAYFQSQGKYTPEGRNRYLSLAAYPYVVGDSVNNHLTTTSLPAMVIEGKPVTNIRQLTDGSIAFDFMKTDTGIGAIDRETPDVEGLWYDLQGRRLQGAPRQHGVYIRNKKKVAF